MHKDPLENFDTSYWQPKDPAWQAAREALWREVQPLLMLQHKSKKALGIIKRYFFKGTLPDWSKLVYWDNSERHLDLLLFLYLHPSRDPAVLAPLRDAYLQLPYLVPDDVRKGLLTLLQIGLLRSCEGGDCHWGRNFVVEDAPDLLEHLPVVSDELVFIDLHLQGQMEQLFRLLYTDPQQLIIRSPQGYEARVPPHSVDDLWQWSRWLTLKLPLSRGAAEMVYQYDYPLEFWYAQCARDELSFRANIRNEGGVSMLLRALYRFYHFAEVQAADDPRAPFVRKVVQMLDERELVAPLRLLWNEVKAGEVEVEDPWGEDCKVKQSPLWSAFKIKREWPEA